MKTILFKQKRHYLISSAFFLFTLLSFIYFLSHLINVKKDTPTAVYGVDLIAYYTAAQLIEESEISEIYAEVKEDFSTVNSGKFFETAKKSGFHGTPTRYVYLPIFLAPFKLLTRFSFSTVATVGLILNLAIVIAVMLLQWHFTKEIAQSTLRAMLIISINLLSFPLFYALKLGQTTLIIYLMICLIYYFTLRDRNIIAGIILGFIVTMKFSPFLFVLYFLYRKRYDLVISCLATVAILILISIITYGLPLHTIYWQYLVNISGLSIAGWSNQSLDAFLLRQLTNSDALFFYSIKASGWLPVVRYAFVLTTFTVIYLILKKSKEIGSQSLYSLEFSAMILCFLIIPLISWLHYFTLAILPTLIIINLCLQSDDHMAKNIILPLTIIGCGMITFHLNSHNLVATFGQSFLVKLLISLPFLGNCLLLLIDLWLIKKHSILIEQQMPTGSLPWSSAVFDKESEE